jgi:hypothetical protein
VNLSWTEIEWQWPKLAAAKEFEDLGEDFSPEQRKRVREQKNVK